MSEITADDQPGSESAAESEDNLARAAAQGPIFTDDDVDDASDETDPETAESDHSDRLASIYGPPPGERRGE